MPSPKSPAAPPGRDILVVGTSAGGVEALQRLVADLPANLPAAVFIVLHTAPGGPGLMPEILRRRSHLPVADVADGDPVERGRIYIAPPDHHLLVESERVRVVHGPKENRVRPAIDPLFRSAAWTHGPRVVGALLTGTLGDGAAGLWAVRTCGGITVVQDPADALYPDMVLNALAQQDVDHQAPLDQLGALLARLARQAPNGQHPNLAARERLQLESTIHAKMIEGREALDALGQLSGFICPECKGPLWQMKDSPAPRFRCHVGHAYSAESLYTDVGESIERALYTALQAVEENALIARQLLKVGGGDDSGESAGNVPHAAFRARAQQLEEDAETLRRLLRRQKNGD